MNMDADGPEWESHEYWKMKVVSMHVLSGKKWVVGTWFYSPSQLRDIKIKERYFYSLPYFFMYLFYTQALSLVWEIRSSSFLLIGTLSIHPVFNVSLSFPALKSLSLIKCPAKMNIHHFDDNDPHQSLISPSSWFYRFRVTWKGSLEPTKSFAILKVSFYLRVSSRVDIYIHSGH
jgi:hypothetical protein